MADQEAPRILLLTGKGGVGKTTTACGTAALAARRGLRTLVLSTDSAHSVADALGTPVGDAPTRITEALWAEQVEVQRRFEASWGEVQEYLRSVLDAVGVDPITAEELTVLPGAEEVLALLELRRQVRSGQWDVVVVDCAPTAETLRLLALPEALGWYMDRLFGLQRRTVRAWGPLLSRVAGVPMPHDPVFAAVERLHEELGDVRRLLAGPTASVRLVLTPERVVVAEARRSLTSLCLYGYRVDGVVANRVFPAADTDDPWLAGWGAAQHEVLAEVADSFAPLAMWRSAYEPREPVGVEALAAFAERTYAGSADPVAPPSDEGPMRVRRTAEGTELELRLTFAQRGDLDLARHGSDLVVTVGGHRRVLALPTALAARAVAGARVRDGWLRVRFRSHEDAAGERSAEEEQTRG